DELDVATAAGGGDLDMHAATLLTAQRSSSMTYNVTNVPPHDFLENQPETRMNAGASSQKRGFLAMNCRTPDNGHALPGIRILNPLI
ncbi:hypothetical protein V6O07_06515, partial [Arthrospira platensis SPKY2]